MSTSPRDRRNMLRAAVRRWNRAELRMRRRPTLANMEALAASRAEYLRRRDAWHRSFFVEIDRAIRLPCTVKVISISIPFTL